MPNRIRTDRSATRCFFIRIGSDSARTSPQSLYRAADDGSRATEPAAGGLFFPSERNRVWRSSQRRRSTSWGDRATSATERTHGHRSPECAKDARHRAKRNDGYSCGVLLNGGHEDEYVFRPFAPNTALSLVLRGFTQK